MPRIARSTVTRRLLVASAVGLFGCPQLLEDRFGTLNGSDAGGLCQGNDCGFPRSGDPGGSAGVAGTPGSGGIGGTPSSDAGSGGASGVGGQTSGGAAGSGGSGSAGTTGSAGNGGTTGSGSAGTGGAAGSSGASSTGGSSGTSGVDYSCWTLNLTSSTQDSASNCIGIDGWNQVALQSPTTLAVSYQSGDVCFNGNVSSSGWGAVYNLTFNGNEGGAWDTTTLGVTGFELTASGNALPPSLQIKYSVYDPSEEDYCLEIVPSGAVSIPFTSTHPDCGSSTGGTPDPTQLSVLRVVFPNTGYNVDFCLQIRALP